MKVMNLGKEKNKIHLVDVLIVRLKCTMMLLASMIRRSTVKELQEREDWLLLKGLGVYRDPVPKLQNNVISGTMLIYTAGFRPENVLLLTSVGLLQELHPFQRKVDTLSVLLD